MRIGCMQPGKVFKIRWVMGWGDRVGWNREGVLCFHPADPSVGIMTRTTDGKYLNG